MLRMYEDDVTDLWDGVLKLKICIFIHIFIFFAIDSEHGYL